MKNICITFKINQFLRFKKYRFFDIGTDPYYYDDYSNESIMNNLSKNCYLPANQMFLELINKHKGKIKLNYAISGVALEQMELYAPEVLESFQKLAKTGAIEFLAMPYSYSLSSMLNKDMFKEEVARHSEKIFSLFKQKPKVFCNTELIFSDEIALYLKEMKYNAVFTEGARHILGWKSPHYLYSSAVNQQLKIILRSNKFSDDIALNFSNNTWEHYPLTADKYLHWLKSANSKEESVNLMMDYETIGIEHKVESGIFDFFKSLLTQIISISDIETRNTSEIVETLNPVASLSIPYPISCRNEERDTSLWLGNELQQEASEKVYNMYEKMKNIDNSRFQMNWTYFLPCNHLSYMSTKFFSQKDLQNPYPSPYEAFINFMNLLSDFQIRIEKELQESKTTKTLPVLVVTPKKSTTKDTITKEVKITKSKKAIK